jgi:thiosulfate reductase cytochrome b subunit
LEPADKAMLDYAAKLTHAPGVVAAADVERLRAAGFDDRAVHDVCLVAAYFAFASRVAVGLGVDLEERFQAPAAAAPEAASPRSSRLDAWGVQTPVAQPEAPLAPRPAVPRPSDMLALPKSPPPPPPPPSPAAPPATPTAAQPATESPGEPSLAAVAEAPEAAARPSEAVWRPAAAPRRLVHRYHWIVRLTHWVNSVLLVGMVASGLQIYNAYERFGIRGTRLAAPNPFDMHPFPKWARLGGWLAGGLNWHFFLMWPLVLNALLYLGYLVVTREWRSLLFRPRDVVPAIQMQLYYLRLRQEHPPQGKHNALQKAAYCLIFLLGVLSVATGLSLWKPVQLAWLTDLFGGYEWARYWHFVAVWLFVAFTLIHVTLVFAVDPASLRGMITGWYRGRFPSHDG